jgi:hypothetical protein
VTADSSGCAETGLEREAGNALYKWGLAMHLRGHPFRDTLSPTPQTGPSKTPVCPSGGSVSGIPAKNDAVLHTFSKIALSARFTPNGAISFEL